LRLLFFVAGWGVVAAACLGLAVWRLRPVYLAQLEARGKRRDGRVADARPPVTDNPLCWKERYLDGIAPVAALRWFPRWLGVGIVLALSVLYAAALFQSFLLGLGPAATMVQAHGCLFLHGFVVVVLTGWLVGMRAAGSITGEVQRQTWDLLLLTDLDAGEIILGKQRGILLAFYPYLLAAMLPALLVSLVAGPEALLGPLFWGALLVPVAYFMAAVGVNFSTSSRTAWGSACTTLVGGSAMVWGFASLAAIPVCLCLGLVAVCRGFSPSDAPAYVITGLTLEVAITGVFLRAGGTSFLRDAERWVRELLVRRRPVSRSRGGLGTRQKPDPERPHV
jgi:hypothetical protein